MARLSVRHPKFIGAALAALAGSTAGCDGGMSPLAGDGGMTATSGMSGSSGTTGTNNLLTDAPTPDASPGEICLSDFPGCGGDLTGTWVLQTQCVASGEIFLESDLSGGAVSITFINGQYAVTEESMTTAKETQFFPSNFLDASANCMAQGQPWSLASPGGSETCGTNREDCVCTHTVNFVSYLGSGTYSTAGVNLTLSQEGGLTYANYCVLGNTLNLTPDINILAQRAFVFTNQVYTKQ
jgi:hypothetical protein